MSSQPAGQTETVTPQATAADPKSGASARKGAARQPKQGTFGVASRLVKGYDKAEVDEFFSRARLAYQAAQSRSEAVPSPESGSVLPNGKDPASMTADDVRTAAFTLRRGGYLVAAVDAALDRLEDALSSAERVSLVAARGEDALIGHLTNLAETLRGRLERPEGERFARGIRGWERTYDVIEVDALCDRLTGYFAGEEEMSVDEVRRAAFRGRRGNLGYREPVVDAFLDRVVTVMSAVD